MKMGRNRWIVQDLRSCRMIIPTFKTLLGTDDLCSHSFFYYATTKQFIVNRAWTGFTTKRKRSNIEAQSLGREQNRIDPMDVNG